MPPSCPSIVETVLCRKGPGHQCSQPQQGGEQWGANTAEGLAVRPGSHSA